MTRVIVTYGIDGVGDLIGDPGALPPCLGLGQQTACIVLEIIFIGVQIKRQHTQGKNEIIHCAKLLRNAPLLLDENKINI